jgi:putative tricarboxylic transport membrane protein
LASFLGYSEALRGSKKPETFGKGNPEGVIGPETANNAAVGGSFVPTLALGIPGSGAATLLISALMMHGMRPGPMIFTQQSDMVFAIMVGFLVTNFMFLALGVFGTRYFGKLLAIPYYILFPIIVILTIIGSYAVRNNMGDVIVMFILGIMGYFLVKKSGFPIAPIILGMVLGPMMENDFRRAFLIENSISGIIFRPIAGSLILVSIIFVLYPIISKAIKNKKSKA